MNSSKEKEILSSPETFLGRFLLSLGNEKPHTWARRNHFPKYAMQNILVGKVPRDKTIRILAEMLKVDFEWLLKGESNHRLLSDDDAHLLKLAKDFCFVPKFNSLEEQPVFNMAFRRYWVEKYLGCSEDDLIAISMMDDSMERVFLKGDLLLINKKVHCIHDGFFCVQWNNQYLVRYIQCLPDYRFDLAANSEFDRVLNLSEKDFNLIGKVVWFGRNLNPLDIL